jgi:hypothetical protein
VGGGLGGGGEGGGGGGAGEAGSEGVREAGKCEGVRALRGAQAVAEPRTCFHNMLLGEWRTTEQMAGTRTRWHYQLTETPAAAEQSCGGVRHCSFGGEAEQHMPAE